MYDPSPEHSQAAFALVDLLAADLTYGCGRTGASPSTDTAPRSAPSQPAQADDDRADGAGTGPAGDAAEVPEKYAMTRKDIRAIRKQAGASRWAIRLGGLLEGILGEAGDLDADVAGMELDGGRSQCATSMLVCAFV